MRYIILMLVKLVKQVQSFDGEKCLAVLKMGCHHSSVNLSAPTIYAFTIYSQIFYYICHLKRKQIKKMPVWALKKSCCYTDKLKFPSTILLHWWLLLGVIPVFIHFPVIELSLAQSPALNVQPLRCVCSCTYFEGNFYKHLPTQSLGENKFFKRPYCTQNAFSNCVTPP